MMKKKYLVAASLIAVIVICLIAAGIVISAGKTEDPVLKQTPATTLPKIELTAFTSDSQINEWGQDPVSQAIAERTGVILHIQNNKGDLKDNLKVMLTSRTYPDILLSVTNDVVALYAEAGAIYPLDDYISQYGTNIRQVFGSDLDKMRSEGDGKIYGVNRLYKGTTSESDAMFNVQYAVLKEFGYPKLKTLDDLFLLLKEYKARHPQYDGSDIVGVSGWAESYGFNITLSNSAMKAGGYQNDGLYVVSNDLNVKYGLTTPTAKAYLKWLNKLYQNGLYDESAVIQDRNTFAEKVKSGRVLVVPTEYWDLSDLEADLRKQGKNDKCYASLPLLLNADSPSIISNYDPTGAWKSLITTNCKEPLDAFKFFDTMWSQDMQVLCNWGVQGIDYDVVNGKRVMRAEIEAMQMNDPLWRGKTGLQMYDYWCVGTNVKGTDGQYISPFGTRESMVREQDAVEKEALSAYGIEIWKDLCPPAKPSDWGFAWTLVLPDNSEGAAAETKANEEIRRKAIPRIVLAQNDNAFEAEWNGFIQEMAASGISTRENEIQAALKKRMTVWR
jgi:putative aldouronate transport system substrate-binding protein